MKKPSETTVSVEQKITVTLGGEPVELTRKEAMKLRDELSTVLNDPELCTSRMFYKTGDRHPRKQVTHQHIFIR